MTEIKSEEQLNEVISNNKFVLVDFWAEWCGPCKMMHPILEKLSEEWGKELIIAKVNTDENIELAKKYGITSIPCFILFKEGKKEKNLVGAVPLSKLKREFEDIIFGEE